MLHPWRGLSREQFLDRASVTPGLVDLPQGRKRFIRYKNISEGFWVSGDLLAGGQPLVTPDTAINASSSITATVAAVNSAGLFDYWRGLSSEAGSNVASATAGLIPSAQVRWERVRRYRDIAEGFWIAPGGPTPQIAPDTGINATSSVTASPTFLRAVAPAAINATSSVTASVVRLRPVTSSAINATSNVSATVGRLRPITPDTGINATSAMSASVARLRPVTPGAINALSDVTASVTTIGLATPSAGMLDTWRGLSREAWSDAASASQGLVDLPQTRKRSIRYKDISEGFWLETQTRGQIVPETGINASSDVTASISDIAVGGSMGMIDAWRGLSQEQWRDRARDTGLSGEQERKRFIRYRGLSEGFWFEPSAAAVGFPAIAPDAINATSSMSAAVVRLRPVTPDTGINATSFVVASIVALRAIRPAALVATSDVTASLTVPVPVAPAIPKWSPFIDDRALSWPEHDPSGVRKGPRLEPPWISGKVK